MILCHTHPGWPSGRGPRGSLGALPDSALDVSRMEEGLRAPEGTPGQRGRSTERASLLPLSQDCAAGEMSSLAQGYLK